MAFLTLPPLASRPGIVLLVYPGGLSPHGKRRPIHIWPLNPREIRCLLDSERAKRRRPNPKGA